jgi:hypothetical protein
MVTPIIDSGARVADPIEDYTADRTSALARVTGYPERGQSAQTVARKVRTILEAPEPRRTYLCDSDVQLSFSIRRFTPARVYERLVGRYYCF